MLVTKFNEVSCAFLDVFLDPAIAYTLNVGSAPTALFFDRGSPVEWGATAARGVPGLVAAVEARVPPLLSPPCAVLLTRSGGVGMSLGADF